MLTGDDWNTMIVLASQRNLDIMSTKSASSSAGIEK